MILTLIIIGRLLLGGAFVVFGLRNIANIPRLTAAMEQKGLLPQPRIWMTVGVGIQIVGGAVVALGFLPIIGWFTWLGALALIAFLILAAYLFHPFWEFSGEEQTPHLNSWITNVALSGAFLMVAAGSAPFYF